MTKPIEGWVLFVDGHPYLYREPMGAAGDCIKVVVNEPNELAMQNYRQVRITFTDEYEAVTKYKRLDVVRNDQYDKQVAEALREERERIWSLIESSEMEGLGGFIQDYDMYLAATKMSEVRRWIFGEEK